MPSMGRWRCPRRLAVHCFCSPCRYYLTHTADPAQPAVSAPRRPRRRAARGGAVGGHGGRELSTGIPGSYDGLAPGPSCRLMAPRSRILHAEPPRGPGSPRPTERAASSGRRGAGDGGGGRFRAPGGGNLVPWGKSRPSGAVFDVAPLPRARAGANYLF